MFSPFGDNTMNRLAGMPDSASPVVDGKRALIASPFCGVFGCALLHQALGNSLSSYERVDSFFRQYGVPQRFAATVASLWDSIEYANGEFASANAVSSFRLVDQRTLAALSRNKDWATVLKSLKDGSDIGEKLNEMDEKGYSNTTKLLTALLLAAITNVALSVETRALVPPSVASSSNVPISPTYSLWREG